MLMLAVKLYQDDLNPNGLPGQWPSQVIEFPDQPDEVTPLPDPYNQAPWITMTPDQLAAQKAANQAAYDTWNSVYQTWLSDRQVRRDGIKGRMDYGVNVVLDFRDYAVAKNLSASDSIALMGALSSLLPYLQLGLLSPAAYLLGTLPSNTFLDSPMDGTVFNVTVPDGQTVRQYFLAEIQAGA